MKLARFGPAALALAGGMLAALAHPPFGVLPGVFGYALVLLALDAPTARPWSSAFRRGWAAGTGYLGVSTLWVSEPFLIDAATHAWQIPFAIAFCAGGIGLLWGIGGLLFRALSATGARGPLRVLAFAAAFGGAEWLRGHLFTGFPWDLPGETFRAGTPLSQGAALVGAYGLGLGVLAAGAAPALLAERRRATSGGVALLAALALGAGGLGLWGGRRLAAAPAPEASALRVRVVQPDLPEPPAWTPEILARAVDRYTALTARPAADDRAPQLVVWPEGALPASLNATLAPAGDLLPVLSSALAPGQTLVLGGARGEEPGADARWFNTLAVLERTSRGLEPRGLYDKHHLVPFGEYLPLKWLFGPIGFRKVLSVPADFAPGSRPAPLQVAGVWMQPLICYEALFPGLGRDDGRRRAAALLNISDDAWFGRWMGPWQHLNLASHRAIEEGLPMIRATPTGVSAVIDAYGRPLPGMLPPGRAGVVDAPLPRAAPPTAYSRFGDFPFGLCVLAFSLLCLSMRRRRAG